MNSDYPKARYQLRASRMIPGQVGLFTLCEFKKGDVVIANSSWVEGRFVTWEEYETLDPETQRQLLHFCLKTNEGIHALKDINNLGISYFANHSCDPLLAYDKKWNYIALRNIKPDTELTIDVEKLMEKTKLSFKCLCGSPNCRQIINI